MRLKFVWLSVAVCYLLGCAACKGGKVSEPKGGADGYYLAYDGNFRDEVIRPEAEAWQKVARVICPRVCDDTEAEWAGHEADSLGGVLLSEAALSMSNGEQMARLCEMQNVIAYGMGYVAAVIGSHSNPEISEAARMIVRKSDAELDSLRRADYGDARMMMGYEVSAYANFSLFMMLGTRYDDGEPQFVANNLAMNYQNDSRIEELFDKLSDPVQAYRYSSIISNTSFFLTYCPLTFWLAGGEFQQTHVDEYIKIGGWFDEQMGAIEKAFEDGDVAGLPQMSTEAYSKIEKQASEYRVRLIELLYEGIISMPE